MCKLSKSLKEMGISGTVHNCSFSIHILFFTLRIFRHFGISYFQKSFGINFLVNKIAEEISSRKYVFGLDICRKSFNAKFV